MARMIGLTPMFFEQVAADDPGRWTRGDHKVYVNVEAIVMISEIAHEDVGASVLIPDKKGHASFCVAESVTTVLDAVQNVQNWPTG